MAKHKNKTAAVSTPKVAVPVLKARFAGLIKIAPDAETPTVRTVEIEGEKYTEFVKLPGVFFSDKLFV